VTAGFRKYLFHLLNRDPLHLVQRDFISRAIVEFCCPRTFVRSHGLRVFQSAAGFQIGGDARGAEGMAAESFRRFEI
jgi:hypothetical protein